MRRIVIGLSAVTALVIGSTAPAGACAGLVSPGGSVRLLRTATLAAYADGVEHYVTSFTFEGGGAEFGAILPLPAIPTKVEKGGEWTLQRLNIEVQPPPTPSPAAAGFATGGTAPQAQVVYQTRIDALDLTVLKGGGSEVGRWAKEHGFKLTPDTPEVLDFYAARSPIFLAARFNARAARDRGQQVGDGTPIHLTIPTANPWVPLRVLGVGRTGSEIVNADVFLLTQRRPSLLPVRAPGVVLERRVRATSQLLDDLRSDKGMGWIPRSMWLTHMTIDAKQRDLRFDLAVDASGRGRPSWRMAGLTPPAPVRQRVRPPVAAKPAATPLAAPGQARRDTAPALVPARAAGADRALPMALALCCVLAAGVAVRRARRS